MFINMINTEKINGLYVFLTVPRAVLMEVQCYQ